MPQPVFSRTFIAASVAVGAAAVTYTVPVGFTAVIKSITVVQFDPTKATVAFVGFSPTGSGNVQLFNVEVATGAATTRKSFYWQGGVAVLAGGSINASTSGTAGGSNYYTVAGYLLTA